VGLGGTADWGGLWPAAVRIWQFGTSCRCTSPPADYLVAPASRRRRRRSWSRWLRSARRFTALFAARSGARAARSGRGRWEWPPARSSRFARRLVWATSRTPVAAVYGWQALLLPTLVFAVPALVGAVVEAWRIGDDGLIDGLRAGSTASMHAGVGRGECRLGGARGLGRRRRARRRRCARRRRGRGARGGQVVASSRRRTSTRRRRCSARQLAYLPTLIVWGASFAAGPGFAVGAGTAVSPAGTTLGVLPGIPSSASSPTTPRRGCSCRCRRSSASPRARLASADEFGAPRESTTAVRLFVFGVIVVLGAAAAALLAVLASGAVGPGRLSTVGPAAGPFAFCVGVELAVGAAIALFSPAHTRDRRRAGRLTGC
jgi:hypothetical protein